MNFDLLIRRVFIVNAPGLGDDDESAYVRINDSAGDLRCDSATRDCPVGRHRSRCELPGKERQPRRGPHLHALSDRRIGLSLPKMGRTLSGPFLLNVAFAERVLDSL